MHNALQQSSWSAVGVTWHPPPMRQNNIVTLSKLQRAKGEFLDDLTVKVINLTNDQNASLHREHTQAQLNLVAVLIVCCYCCRKAQWTTYAKLRGRCSLELSNRNIPSDGWTVFAETNWISGRRRLCCRHLPRDSTSTVCDVIKGTTQISDGKDDFLFFHCHSLTDKQNVCIFNKTAHLNRLKGEKKWIPRVCCLFRPIWPCESSSPTPTSLKSSFKSSERNEYFCLFLFFSL